MQFILYKKRIHGTCHHSNDRIRNNNSTVIIVAWKSRINYKKDHCNRKKGMFVFLTFTKIIQVEMLNSVLQTNAKIDMLYRNLIRNSRKAMFVCNLR